MKPKSLFSSRAQRYPRAGRRHWFTGVFLLVAAGITHADGLFCQSSGPGGMNFGTAVAAGTYQCAGAGAGTGNGAPVVIAPDQRGPGMVGAAQVSAGSGVFAAAAAANATAAPGLLRAFASADSFAPPPGDGSSFAFSIGRADASFYDVGNLAASGGSVLGDPVAVRLTIDVRGSFLNLSEGTDQVWVGRNNTDLLLNRTSSVLSLRPADYMQIDLPGFHVGDELSLYMRLTAVAGATNERDLPNLRSQIADLGSTGHLYLDILSANAEFASASGHDYGSNLVTAPIPLVPEPAPAALLAMGLCAILALKRKKRRHVSP